MGNIDVLPCLANSKATLRFLIDKRGGVAGGHFVQAMHFSQSKENTSFLVIVLNLFEKNEI